MSHGVDTLIGVPDRPTRGRMSRVQQLPDDIRERLDALLRSGVSQRAILDQLAPLLTEAGEKPLSRSSLNRYATRMESVGRRLREAKEAANAWTAKFGEPRTDLEGHVIELVRTLSFETAMAHGDSGDPVEPDTLAQLALVTQRLGRASKLADDRERAIRLELAEQAAAAGEGAARRKGVSPETAAEIRKAIEGVA